MARKVGTKPKQESDDGAQTKGAELDSTPVTSPDEVHSPGTDWLNYLSPREWIYFIALLTLGFVLRWYDLEARPLHHDESIHANFAKAWYDNPESNFYKYDPTYHGGALYELYRLTFSTFGVTNWGLRAPMALIGCLLLLTPFLFRRYLSKMSVFALTGAFALSPTLIYWSRFSRHDPLVLVALFLILFGATIAKPIYKAPIIILGLILHVASKEDIYVHLAMFGGYLIYESALAALQGTSEKSFAVKIFRYVASNRLALIIGLVFGGLLYTYFFTSGFRYYDALNAPKLAWKYWSIVLYLLLHLGI